MSVLSQSQLADADLQAAAHYLSLARDALSHALARTSVPDLFAADVTSRDIVSRSHTQTAARRVDSAMMHARKATEAIK
jgi:hypothetical protein